MLKTTSTAASAAWRAPIRAVEEPWKRCPCVSCFTLSSVENEPHTPLYVRSTLAQFSRPTSSWHRDNQREVGDDVVAKGGTTAGRGPTTQGHAREGPPQCDWDTPRTRGRHQHDSRSRRFRRLVNELSLNCSRRAFSVTHRASASRETPKTQCYHRSIATA